MRAEVEDEDEGDVFKRIMTLAFEGGRNDHWSLLVQLRSFCSGRARRSLVSGIVGPIPRGDAGIS